MSVPSSTRPQDPAAATLPPLPARRSATRRRRPLWRDVRRDWRLYSLLLIPVVYLVIFKYLPMAGNIIAFRRFRAGGSMFGDEWVGLRYVQKFLEDPAFWKVFSNTAILGVLSLIIVFPMPIILALLLNEIRKTWFKRFVQTVSYLPHFMSIVIVVGMVMQLVSLNGTVNSIISALGGDPVNFIAQAGWFRTLYIGSEVWQTVGWGTILYLAALTQVDTQLYEAARIDGANRLQQTFHVTIPGITPTMITLLILNIGTFMAVGFEKILLLYNPLTYDTADVIATYLFRVGLVSNNFSYATAIGLFEAIIGLTLVLSANALSRRLVGSSLW
ncbi:ABC transporter permease [Brachybacterium hainanense]|uniref:ABC transporter permease n=1 Tax=Brachybacterium hainanense TaxID=1541174 RepID=A0ABV6R6K5_9MICO